MKKIVFLMASLSLMILISGCLGISMYTKVQKDGNISDMKIEINTTSYVYGLIQSSARQQGYSTAIDTLLYR